MTQQMTQSATYSFSSKPKAVNATRKKYRERDEEDISMYRSPKETCITWDRRVHRGNTYSMHTQNAIREALKEVEAEQRFVPRARRRQKEGSVFDMPLPEPDRPPVDLSANLVAKAEVVEVEVCEAQTDEFLPEPPPEQHRTQKTGIDASTQVEDGELFIFDAEAEPILDVLVNKTLEQSIMEVEEEHEMERMREFKVEWRERQESMVASWEQQVLEERERWKVREEVLARQREQKRREARVLLKIQAMGAATRHLTDLTPNAVGSLQELAFPDTKALAINRLFIPHLLGAVQGEVRQILGARASVDSALEDTYRQTQAARDAAFEAQRARHEASLRRQHEERQIRKGRIRMVVEDGRGGRVLVGPVEVSESDSVAEIHGHVHEWLKENSPELARSFPWGVALLIDGQRMEDSSSLFNAKAGQITMIPEDEPPPAEEEEEGEAAGEEGAEGAEEAAEGQEEA